MKRILYTFTAILLFSPTLFFSCKKDEAPKTDLAAIKKEWVTGSWKQKDIQLGVSTNVTVPGVGKIPLKEGMSMLDDPIINALLTGAVGANPFVYTRNNIYDFNGDGNYEVDGIVDFGGGTSLLAHQEPGILKCTDRCWRCSLKRTSGIHIGSIISQRLS